jgi:hypothetical protein
MDVLYYVGNMGFCANLINLIRVIEYCFRRNVKLYVCCDYSMHGKIHELFDFGLDVQIVTGVPPGWSITENPHFEVVHPDWDHGDTLSLRNYIKINSIDVPTERLREIALRFVPKVSLETTIRCPEDTAAQRQQKSRASHASTETIPEKYDAVHIRRGDAMTSGEGCKYFHAMDYIAKTTYDDVFVMSDDHRVLDEISGSKKIHHTIPETEVGNWTTLNYVTNPGQPVFALRSDKLDVTKRLIQEMYIAAKSQTFVYTNSSVGHFVSLIHQDPTRCINLQSPPSE